MAEVWNPVSVGATPSKFGPVDTTLGAGGPQVGPIGDPTAPQDAATKHYVDVNVGSLSSQFGTLAARPVASSLNLGVTYYATDNGELFRNVQSAAATFAWTLLPNASIPSQLSTWATQSNWYIKPVGGLDTNDGASAGQGAGNIGPLQTLTEWARRIIAAGGVKTGGTTMTVNLLGNTLTNDEPRGTIQVFQSLGATLRFTGSGGVTVLRTGIMTPVTTVDPASNTAWQGTDSLGSNWVAYISAIGTGIRVRNKTLPNSFWPALDLGAGACQFSQPMQTPNFALGPFGQTMSILSNNDAYNVEQLPSLTAPWGLTIDGDNTDILFAGQGPVVFDNLQFASTYLAVFNGSAAHVFYDCDIGNCRADTPFAFFVNCRMVNYVGIGPSSFFGGLATSLTIETANGFVLDQRFLVQGAPILVRRNGYVAVCLAQVFNSASSGIVIEAGGGAYFTTGIGGTKEAFGKNNANYGVEVRNTCSAVYNTDTSGLTITGGAQDVGLGTPANPFQWAQIPHVDTDLNIRYAAFIQGT